MINCLHIANDFSLTKVHKNLYSQLDQLTITQTIFNPVRKNTPVGNNIIKFENTDSEIIYSEKLKSYHRVLFRSKIDFLYRDLKIKCDLEKINIIHATTLFSDGALALKIHKKFKTPFIVAVRGTDVSLFLKYRPDLIILLKEILENASHIIFLGKALQKQLFKNKYVKYLEPRIKHKVKVISNGIDDYWLSNTNTLKDIVPHKILYIGRFDSNKNTVSLIEAILSLRSEFPNLKLDLVGSGGGNEDKVINLSDKHREFINFYGPIYDKAELQKIYIGNDIFAMPSYSETFGLVYIEALSQGLPILCSKNQGVDNTFEFKIGEFVNPKSTESIAIGIKKIINNYSEYDINNIDFEQFSWVNIAKTYLKLYKEICFS